MRAEKKKAYWVVGVVAATVSAATAAYIIWTHGKKSGVASASETVEDLLDRCHDQVKQIEQRLGELPQAA
jgi:flagellar basal body-associated protein FliL